MLAKRITVAAFAALAIVLAPLAFKGPADLFVDMQPSPVALASN